MGAGIVKSKTIRGQRRQRGKKDSRLLVTRIENKGFRNKMKERILNKLNKKK